LGHKVSPMGLDRVCI